MSLTVFDTILKKNQSFLMSLTDSNRRKPYNDFEFYLAAEVYAVAFSYLENSSQHFNNLESHIAKSIFLILN